MRAIYEVATQSGQYTLTPSPRMYTVRDSNAQFIGIVHECGNKDWRVPASLSGYGLTSSYETAEDAIEALLRANRVG